MDSGKGWSSSPSPGVNGNWIKPNWAHLTPSVHPKRPVLGVHWKDWCWSWSSNTLVTSCEELTFWKRPWCWEGLRAGGEGDDRGWDGWMASLTRWTWVWVNSESWWWTGRPGMLRFMGWQRVGHDWVTELNWVNIASHKKILTVWFYLDEMSKIGESIETESILVVSWGWWLMVQSFFLEWFEC